MNLAGISDSFLSLTRPPKACSHCHADARVDAGQCLGCLLQAGVEEEILDDAESLDVLLAEIDIRDSDWRLGNYQILEEIGRGGMGVIYRARQRHSKRVVALKRVLSYHSDSRETLERFRREAEAAASLDHPNLLPIYEVGEADGLPFFTMKYATGGTLQQAAPALSANPRECVRLLAKVTRAVAHAHREGILHRDLKPGNILLDGHGEPMVSDFGLAKWIDANTDLTRSLAIFGTPGYIAPEQAKGQRAKLTGAADIYSLGAILFELLSGQPPFLGEHALAVIHQAAEKPAPKLRSIIPSADRDLETICAKCLEREAHARYRSATDLADDLERWLEGWPIVARPVSPPIRLWRWSRRNPLLAGAAAGCLALALVAGLEIMSSSRLGTIVRDAENARRSVVITPFEDLDALSTASEEARGVTQAFLQGLQQESTLRVSSSATLFGERGDFWRSEEWRHVGEKSGARGILTGSIRQRDGKCRIVFRVISAASGAVVVKKICDVSRNDFGPAVTLAAAELRRMFAEEPPGTGKAAAPETNGAAAREYLRAGKEYYFRYTPADIKTSLGYFRKARAADPKNAEAHAMFAVAWARRAQQVPEDFTEQGFAEAMAAAATAIELDPALAVGHRARAALLAPTDITAAQEAAVSALELEPEEVLPAGVVGMGWRMRGRPDLALRWVQRSASRNQRPGMNAAISGDALTELGEDTEAEKAFTQHLEFWPDVPDAHAGWARLLLCRGDFAGARSKCEEAIARYPGHFYPRQMLAIVKLFTRDFAGAEEDYRKLLECDRNGGTTFYFCVSNLSGLGFLQSRSGAAGEGRSLLLEDQRAQLKALAPAPKNREFLYDLAGTQAALGEGEACLETLGRSVENGWIDYRALSLDPRFDSLRNDERFARILTGLEQRVTDLREGRIAVSDRWD